MFSYQLINSLLLNLSTVYLSTWQIINSERLNSCFLTDLTEKTKQLKETKHILSERDTHLMEREKQVEEKDRLLIFDPCYSVFTVLNAVQCVAHAVLFDF